MARPMATVCFVPMRSAMRALVGAVTIITKANGSRRTPAPSGVHPWTNWRYWVMRKNMPNMPKNTRVIAAAPPVNRFRLK